MGAAEADELIELRAALIQLAKALEMERACVMRILRVVERRMDSGGTAVERIIVSSQPFVYNTSDK